MTRAFYNWTGKTKGKGVGDVTLFLADLVDQEALPRSWLALISASVYEDLINTRTWLIISFKSRSRSQIANNRLPEQIWN